MSRLVTDKAMQKHNAAVKRYVKRREMIEAILAIIILVVALGIIAVTVIYVLAGVFL